MSDIRQMVREIISRELGELRESGAFADTTPRTQAREEIIILENDSDLSSFVRRLMNIADDGRARAEIAAGRWVFRLEAGRLVAPRSSAGGSIVHFQRGLVTESLVAGVQESSRTVRAGPRVVFTPLALDELQRRGIQIERVSS